MYRLRTQFINSNAFMDLYLLQIVGMIDFILYYSYLSL